MEAAQIQIDRTNNILLVIYFFLALLIFPFYRYYIGSADFIAYLTIAEKYASGNFNEALNSYWGPLVSWLTALLIRIGITSLLSFKIIQLFAGGAAMYLSCRLITHQNIFSIILKIALIPCFLSYAYLYGSPDLLMLVWYLCFAFILQRKIYPSNTYSSLWIGTLGALMYFTKGFGFLFFITAFTVVTAFLFIRHKERSILKKYMTAIFTFLILSSVWIFFLSKEEKKFTISSAGKYNMALVSPNENPDLLHEMRHPIQRGILLPLPNPSALSAWEQPDKLLMRSWNPFSSFDDISAYMNVVFINIRNIRHFHFDFYFGLDPGALLLLSIAFLYFKNKNLLFNFFRENIFLILTGIFCTALYCLILAVHRYLWINDILIVLLFAELITQLQISKKIIFFISFLAFFLAIFEPVNDLIKNINADKKTYETCQRLLKNKMLNGRIASLDIGESELNYHQSSIVAYWTKNKYYGMITHSNFITSGMNEMKKYGINYLLVWEEQGHFEQEKYGMKKVFLPEINLSVYSLAGDTH